MKKIKLTVDRDECFPYFLREAEKGDEVVELTKRQHDTYKILERAYWEMQEWLESLAEKTSKVITKQKAPKVITKQKGPKVITKTRKK